MINKNNRNNDYKLNEYEKKDGFFNFSLYKRMVKISLVNKAITDKLAKNVVILDPAGLSYMKSSFLGAGGASGAIYKLINVNKPNNDVITHFNKFKSEDDLYKNNSANLSVARFGSYNDNQIKIIHAIGPDFRNSKYLQDILSNTQQTDKLFFKLYEDVYIEFIKAVGDNRNKLTLRLLPVSSGIFINNDFISKIKLFKAMLNAYVKLNEKYKIQPKIYLYDKTDYDIMKFLAKTMQKLNLI